MSSTDLCPPSPALDHVDGVDHVDPVDPVDAVDARDAGAQRAPARAWWGLAVLMLPVLIVSIDNTVLSFALPAIARDLRPSAATQLWIVDVYPLVLAALLVTMGNLGDRIGRRRLLLIGAIGFAGLSVVAAYSTSADMLLVARALTGVFGAMLMPCTLSLLRGMFPNRNDRRLAIAIWATGFATGAALGPLLGGVLLEHGHWGWVFLLALPFLLPLLAAAPFLIPESRDPNPGPLDPVALLASMLTFAPAVYALKHLATQGLDVVVVVCVAASLLAGAFLVRRLLTQPNPLLDVRLFLVPAFTGSVLVNLLSVVAFTGLLFFLSQHVQLVLGLSPIDAGLLLLPGMVAMVVAGLYVVRLVRRFRPASLMAFGLSLGGLAYLVFAIGGGGVPLGVIVAAYAALCIGVAMAETLANDLIISSVPPAKAGAASAVSETAYELGAVLGTTILGGILAASYAAHVRVPAGLSAADDAAARETLGGALSVAEGLPTAAGNALAASAKHAFDTGIVWTAGAGALLMAGAVVLALRTVRTAR